MCGRYSFARIMGAKVRFELENELVDFKANYNAAPGQYLPVVTKHSPNHISEMKWGLIPFWAKEASIGYKMINARAETIADKVSFKRSLKTMRCLIPADGFYEWAKTDEGKIPYYFKLKSGEIFGFAGIYDVWKDPAGQEVKSFTIITTEPNSLMEPIHNRMPVILEKEDEEFWLNPDNVESEHLLPYLKPYPSSKMEKYPVSKEVNKPTNNNEDLIKEVDSEDSKETPSLFNTKSPNSK